jgi:hypothetical protein
MIYLGVFLAFLTFFRASTYQPAIFMKVTVNTKSIGEHTSLNNNISMKTFNKFHMTSTYTEHNLSY